MAFTSLLWFKHLYLALAPAVGLFLLFHYCCNSHTHQSDNNGRAPQRFDAGKSIGRFICLSSIVSLISFAALFPFYKYSSDFFAQLQQMMVRLFPFQRGLVHTYWASNIWALYLFVDKLVAAGLRLCSGTAIGRFCAAFVHNETSALVGTPVVFPNISPLASAALVALTMAPALIALARHPHTRLFVPVAAYTSMCTFMCGWHVHEKAIITPLVLWAVVVLLGQAPHAYSNYFLFLFIAVNSLFPLLFEWREQPLLLLITAATTVTAAALAPNELKLSKGTYAYCIGMVGVQLFALIHQHSTLFR